MAKQDLSKGKTLNNIEDYAVIFNGLTVEQKTAVLRNLSNVIRKGKDLKGKKLTESDALALDGLQRWSLLNKTMGENCPPSSLSTFIKTKN